MFKQHLALSLVFSLVLLAPGIRSAQPATAQTSAAPETNARSALFIENAGQWPGAARFQVWGSPLGAGTTWLAADAIWLTVASGESKFAATDAPVSKSADLQPVNLPPAPLHALKLTFPGSNPDVRIEPFEPLTTTVSYFIGNDPAQWHPAVPVWRGVRYADLYPGVDLEVLGEEGAMTQRLVVRDGIMPEDVRLRVEGAAIVEIDQHVVQLSSAAGALSVPLPEADFSYQVVGVSECSQAVSRLVEPSSSARQYLIEQPRTATDDPTDLLYSTFLGGSEDDWGRDVAVDRSGRAFVTGYTWSSDFPTTPGAFDTTHNGDYDGFLVKLNAAGSELEYATFFGGGDDLFVYDWAYAIAVDELGQAFVTGHTESSDFPITPGAYDTSLDGFSDAFVVKFNATGSMLEYATFLGGSGGDWGRAVDVDGLGRAFVTGETDSSDFPTTPGTLDGSFNGYDDAFVVVLNVAGSGLEYATFLGGSDDDYGRDVTVDRSGRAFVTGKTSSSDFPTTLESLNTSFNGYYDAFVVMLNAAGSKLEYATFLGGSSSDESRAVDVDGSGRAFVTGDTLSSDFPTTPGAFDTDHNGRWDAFVVVLNADGSGLEYATFLGGSGHDRGTDVAVDESGQAFATGYTWSSDFPTTPGAFDTSLDGYSDAYVVKLNSDGSGLDYATFLGGSNGDSASTIAVDRSGQAFVAGYTGSDDFPTTPGAFDTSFNAFFDATVAKLDLSAPPTGVKLNALQADSGETLACEAISLLLAMALAGIAGLALWRRRESPAC